MNTILLNGQSLTLDEIEAVARQDAQVEIDPSAWQLALESRSIVLEWADSEKEIYGLNTGLGANKDNVIPAEAYHQFNEQILFSHSIALPPFASRDEVRATMLCRLNGLLNGCSGIQPQALILLKDMLNHKIHPRIPQRGSVGMSDLGNMAYLGLAMIGKGMVEYRSASMDAKSALEAEGLTPLVLGVKDGLPLVSSNAFSVGRAALLCLDIERILNTSDLLYAMEYEAIGLNTEFLDPRSCQKHPHSGYEKSLKLVRDYLKGSSLWESNNSSLHSAISHSSSCAIHGAVRDGYEYVKGQMPHYINASDDCPYVVLEDRAIISSSNFIITGLAIAFEMMDLSLAHLSKLTANRLLRLDNEYYSSLPRFLRPQKHVIAFSTIQKTISALDTEISHLASSASLYYHPTANEAEDHGCNTPYVLDKTQKIVDCLYYLLGIEAMHAAQAYDVGKRKADGQATHYAYEQIRNEIPMLLEDNRDLGADMCKAFELIKQQRLFAPEHRI